MENTKILDNIGILGEIRQRLGCENENDTHKDKSINKMSANEIIKEYAAWQIGDGHWWTMLKSHFDAIERMKKL